MLVIRTPATMPEGSATAKGLRGSLNTDDIHSRTLEPLRYSSSLALSGNQIAMKSLELLSRMIQPDELQQLLVKGARARSVLNFPRLHPLATLSIASPICCSAFDITSDTERRPQSEQCHNAVLYLCYHPVRWPGMGPVRQCASVQMSLLDVGSVGVTFGAVCERECRRLHHEQPPCHQSEPTYGQRRCTRIRGGCSSSQHEGVAQA